MPAAGASGHRPVLQLSQTPQPAVCLTLSGTKGVETPQLIPPHVHTCKAPKGDPGIGARAGHRGAGRGPYEHGCQLSARGSQPGFSRDFSVNPTPFAVSLSFPSGLTSQFSSGRPVGTTSALALSTTHPSLLSEPQVGGQCKGPGWGPTFLQDGR